MVGGQAIETVRSGGGGGGGPTTGISGYASWRRFSGATSRRRSIDPPRGGIFVRRGSPSLVGTHGFGAAASDLATLRLFGRARPLPFFFLRSGGPRDRSRLGLGRSTEGEIRDDNIELWLVDLYSSIQGAGGKRGFVQKKRGNGGILPERQKYSLTEGIEDG